MQAELSRMQERAKFLLESCELEQALALYSHIYSVASANQLSSEFLDDYAELCSSLGSLEEAKKLYSQSISWFPSENPSKYFALAQMSTGESSVELYTKGIGLSRDKGQVACAYSALAEIYMTDLCDDAEAESKCELYISKALETDDLCMDAYLTLSNLRLIRANTKEAKEALLKLKIVLENCGTDNLPSSDFLVQCCKNFIECEDFEGLEFVSQFGLCLDEGHHELIYLRAFALTKLGQKDEALESLNNLLLLNVTPEIREASEEIIRNLSI